MSEMVRYEEQTDNRTWWQRNKKKVIGGIVGGAVIVGGILLFKNWDEVSSWTGNLFKPKKLNAALPKPTVAPVIEMPPAAIKSDEVTRVILKDGKEQLVHMHVRNLPEGWAPSAEKLARAEELGIDLEEGQTWVIEYLKNHVA